MKKLTKIIALVLALVCICTAFAACGGNKDKEKTPAVKVINYDLTSEQYAFGVDKDQPELLTKVNEILKEMKSDGTFDAICNNNFGSGTPQAVKSAVLDKSKDQLIVATNAEFEPFEYMKGENYYGVDMEMAAYIAKKLGKELVIKNMNFDAVCLSVGQHKCDIAMAGLTISEDRKEYVNFSDPYYEASQRLIVKGTDTTFDACKSADDVNAILNSLTEDKKIGCQQGTTGNSFIEGSNDLGFPGLKAKAVAYKNGSLAVQDLINNGVDYVIIDAAPAERIAKAINEMS
ncbi:MAG TPA: amino acid ABC transporter substrate-binding protein [Ruminococcaceae bacterium]|nr:amino acid ABC transporter substrate-binding protein [Oscillospiraceae bacterium]